MWRSTKARSSVRADVGPCVRENTGPWERAVESWGGRGPVRSWEHVSVGTCGRKGVRGNVGAHEDTVVRTWACALVGTRIGGDVGTYIRRPGPF